MESRNKCCTFVVYFILLLYTAYKVKLLYFVTYCADAISAMTLLTYIIYIFILLMHFQLAFLILLFAYSFLWMQYQSFY